LGAACIGLLALAACDEQAGAPPPKPAVGVRPAAMKGVSEAFEFVGHIQASIR
jgi:membrane fusion protein (multidrug efflux system)